MKARRGAPNSTTTAAASGRSSTGRAPVSKTGGWGFDSLRPCESWKVPRAPDPRPGREASEQRGTGLTVTWPWETSPDSDPRDGNEGELDSGQHQAGAGPALRERLPVAAATHGGDAGMPALRHMRRLGNWLARLAVDQVPAGRAGSSPARRTCRHMEGPADGRRRQPSRKRKAHTGVRVRSSLPPRMEGDAGVARRPVATRVVASAMRFDSSTFRQALSVQLEWTPACRAGDHGFDSHREHDREHEKHTG